MDVFGIRLGLFWSITLPFFETFFRHAVLIYVDPLKEAVLRVVVIRCFGQSFIRPHHRAVHFMYGLIQPFDDFLIVALRYEDEFMYGRRYDIVNFLKNRTNSFI